MNSKKILILGSSNTDMTIKSAVLPVPGQTVTDGLFYMGPGGKGANQAVAAARLGGDAKLVCKVGKDIFGDNAVNHYRKEGLDVSGVLRSDLPSGIALINVDAKGENCIAVAPGANTDITEAEIEGIADEIRAAGILLLQLEIPLPAVMRAARIAHEAGVKVVLNPAPYRPLPDEIFRYVDLFIPNETELAAFSGMPVESQETALAAAHAMVEKGVKEIIVTLGSKGSLITDGVSVRPVPSFKVQAVDTTAAGDTYCGALCVALSEGKPLEEAALFASKASSLSVTKAGAQASMPYRKEIVL